MKFIFSRKMARCQSLGTDDKRKKELDRKAKQKTEKRQRKCCREGEPSPFGIPLPSKRLRNESLK